MFRNSTVLLLLLYSNGILCKDWHSGRELCRNQLISYGHFAHIRLVGFNSSLVGYLEICRDGAWKTVTTNDGEWGRKEATVVCRELGYLDAITFSHIEGQGLAKKSSSLHLGSISCMGTEEFLSECAGTEDLRGNPTPKKDILVLCNQDPMLGSIRLVGGSSKSNEGILEVYHPHPSYRWSTVCNNEWTDTDALIACKQMGFSSGRSKFYSFDNSARVVPRKRYDYFYCNGTETTLLECRHRGPYPYKCNSARYAGVVCEGGSSPEVTPLTISFIVLSGLLLIFFVLVSCVILAKKLKTKKWLVTSPYRAERLTESVHPFQYPNISNFVPPPTYEETIFSTQEDTQSEAMTRALQSERSGSLELAELNTVDQSYSEEAPRSPSTSADNHRDREHEPEILESC